MMPRNLEELAVMLANRDGISVEEERIAIDETAEALQEAFETGSITLAEDILLSELGLELDYIDIFF